MSHYFGSEEETDELSVFSIRNKQMMLPKVRRSWNMKQNQETLKKKAQLLKGVCKQFKEKTEYDIMMKNREQIQHSFHSLRQKLRKREKDTLRKSVAHFFDDKLKCNDNKLDVHEIINLRPIKIDIQKKFHCKIKLKMHVQQECLQIDSEKEKYREWLNESHNRATHSPIFSKMAYLISRSQHQEPPENKNPSTTLHATAKIAHRLKRKKRDPNCNSWRKSQ